jgi:hypothetical protein
MTTGHSRDRCRGSMHPPMRLHSRRVSAVVVALGTVLALPAQATVQPLSPKATFYRLYGDNAAAPLVLDLPGLGIAPGDWLRLTAVGDASLVANGADDQQNIVAVFSASSQLQPPTVQRRVVDAVPAGPRFASGSTYLGGLPTDVSADFVVARPGWGNGVRVQVPPGATFLFVGVHDSPYGDNTDADGDYALRVEPVPAPALAGSGEHLELLTGVGALPTALPEQKAAAGGALLTVLLEQPLGHLDGALWLTTVDAVPTGAAPVAFLPAVWGGSPLVVASGIVPGIPGGISGWSIVVPPGLQGTTLLVQGGALAATSRNGVYQTTAAHRIVLQ